MMGMRLWALRVAATEDHLTHRQRRNLFEQLMEPFIQLPPENEKKPSLIAYVIKERQKLLAAIPAR